jgi:hypothetical protein
MTHIAFIRYLAITNTEASGDMLGKCDPIPLSLRPPETTSNSFGRQILDYMKSELEASEGLAVSRALS